MEKLKNELKQAAVFIVSIKWILLITTLLFIIIAVGSHFALSIAIAKNPETVTKITDELELIFIESKDIITDDGGIHPIKLFFNNFIATLLSTALGFIPFLFISVLVLFTNAALIGALTALLQYMGENVFANLLLSVAPHGIFEIPALLISLACGFLLCREITAMLFHKNRFPILRLVGELARVLVLIVVPLLALSAFIESYITPLFITLIK